MSVETSPGVAPGESEQSISGGQKLAAELALQEAARQQEIIATTEAAAKPGPDGSLPLGDRTIIANARFQMEAAQAAYRAHKDVAAKNTEPPQ